MNAVSMSNTGRWLRPVSHPPDAKRFNVAVVGLPSSDILSKQGSLRKNAPGVGKSSLCSRFVRSVAEDDPSAEKQHSSIVSAEEFEKAGGHHVYHGSVAKRVGDDVVIFRLLEHTTFMDEKFQSRTLDDEKNRCYANRATNADLASSFKLSDLAPGNQERSLPEDFQVDAFVFVIDFMQVDEVITLQLKLLSDIAARINSNHSLKKPLAVAMTKCDVIPERVVGLMEKRIRTTVKHLPVYQLSGKTGVGVDSVFARVYEESGDDMLISSANPLSYSASNTAKLLAEKTAFHDVHKLLESMTDFDRTWKQFLVRRDKGLEHSLAALIFFRGEADCLNLYRQRLLSLQMERFKSSLRQAVAGHPDLKTMDMAELERSVFQENSQTSSLADHSEDIESFLRSHKVSANEEMKARVQSEAEIYYENAAVSVLGGHPHMAVAEGSVDENERECDDISPADRLQKVTMFKKKFRAAVTLGRNKLSEVKTATWLRSKVPDDEKTCHQAENENSQTQQLLSANDEQNANKQLHETIAMETDDQDDPDMYVVMSSKAPGAQLESPQQVAMTTEADKTTMSNSADDEERLNEETRPASLKDLHENTLRTEDGKSEQSKTWRVFNAAKHRLPGKLRKAPKEKKDAPTSHSAVSTEEQQSSLATDDQLPEPVAAENKYQHKQRCDIMTNETLVANDNGSLYEDTNSAGLEDSHEAGKSAVVPFSADGEESLYDEATPASLENLQEVALAAEDGKSKRSKALRALNAAKHRLPGKLRKAPKEKKDVPTSHSAATTEEQQSPLATDDQLPEPVAAENKHQDKQRCGVMTNETLVANDNGSLYEDASSAGLEDSHEAGISAVVPTSADGEESLYEEATPASQENSQEVALAAEDGKSKRSKALRALNAAKHRLPGKLRKAPKEKKDAPSSQSAASTQEREDVEQLADDQDIYEEVCVSLSADGRRPCIPSNAIIDQSDYYLHPADSPVLRESLNRSPRSITYSAPSPSGEKPPPLPDRGGMPHFAAVNSADREKLPSPSPPWTHVTDKAQDGCLEVYEEVCSDQHDGAPNAQEMYEDVDIDQLEEARKKLCETASDEEYTTVAAEETFDKGSANSRENSSDVRKTATTPKRLSRFLDKLPSRPPLGPKPGSDKKTCWYADENEASRP